MKDTQTRHVPLVIFAAGIALLIYSLRTRGGFPPSLDGNFLPNFSLLAVVVASAVLLTRRTQSAPDAVGVLGKLVALALPAAAPIALYLYLRSVLHFGLAVSSFIGVALGLIYFGNRSILRVVAISAGFAAVVWLMIVQMMGAYLPPALFF